jgi:SAM-dependent methyltransferase
VNIIEKIKNLVVASNLYWGKDYPAGYQTLRVGFSSKFEIKGQRDPAERLKLIPDFTDKIVLDIGCNTGGMLHDSKAFLGIGIDNNPDLINVANLVKEIGGDDNLSFFTFDLEKRSLEQIRYFLPEDGVDVVLLMSMCLHLKNWREVIDFAGSISDEVVFESNGDPLDQAEQIAYVKNKFKNVVLLSDRSDDDELVKNRKLFHLKEYGRD